LKYLFEEKENKWENGLNLTSALFFIKISKRSQQSAAEQIWIGAICLIKILNLKTKKQKKFIYAVFNILIRTPRRINISTIWRRCLVDVEVQAICYKIINLFIDFNN